MLLPVLCQAGPHRAGAILDRRREGEMASPREFRLRSPERDRETDEQRFARLTQMLDQVSAEIQYEKDGLQARHVAATADAGFLVEAMENDEAGSSSALRLGDLSDTIAAYQVRIEGLSQQLIFIDELRQAVAGFVETVTERN